MLEIGCGWGGFAIQAATDYGCRVTGLTLSPSQAGFARARIEPLGLDDRIEIREEDYRLTEGRFSKIASIEMFEAIGLAEYGDYFSAVDRLLARDGLACLQTIGVPDWRFERYRRRPDWIQQTIFPGSLLPSLEAIARSVARTRLQINGVEEIGFGYARTLREWRRERDARTSTRCARSATTSASCGSGCSTSRTARRGSRYGRCATCRSCSATPPTTRCPRFRPCARLLSYEAYRRALTPVVRRRLPRRGARAGERAAAGPLVVAGEPRLDARSVRARRP